MHSSEVEKVDSCINIKVDKGKRRVVQRNKLWETLEELVLLKSLSVVVYY